MSLDDLSLADTLPPMGAQWPDALECPPGAVPTWSDLESAIEAVVHAGQAAIDQLGRYAQLLDLMGARNQCGVVCALSGWEAASDRLRHLLDADLEG